MTSDHAMIRINFWVKSCACWNEIINWICASGHIIPRTRHQAYSVQCTDHNMLYSTVRCTRHGEHSSEHRQSVSKKLSWGGQLGRSCPAPCPAHRVSVVRISHVNIVITDIRTVTSGLHVIHPLAYVTIDQIMVKQAGNKYFFWSFSQIERIRQIR